MSLDVIVTHGPIKENLQLKQQNYFFEIKDPLTYMYPEKHSGSGHMHSSTFFNVHLLKYLVTA